MDQIFPFGTLCIVEIFLINLELLRVVVKKENPILFPQYYFYSDRLSVFHIMHIMHG